MGRRCLNQFVFVCYCLALLLTSGLFMSTECVAQTVLKIGGTGAALGAMSKIADAFHKLHPDIEVKILPSLGSSGGIKAVAASAIQLAFSSRQLKHEERGVGLIELEYARTPFVFVTRDPVGVAGVTFEGVGQMFSGAIPTWPNGQRIRPIIRPDEEADTRIAKAISAGLARTLDSLQKVPGMVIALTDQDCSEAIGAVSGTLAFTSLSQVLTWERKYQVLSFNGIVPSVANLSNGTYPFYRSFYVVKRADSGESAEMFVDFIRSPQARKILEDTGNQPLVKALAEN